MRIMSSDVWREVSQLAPCLYVSGVSALNDKTLENLGINVIVNSATNLANFQTRDKSIVTVKVPVHDVSSANLRPYLKVVQSLKSYYFLCHPRKDQPYFFALKHSPTGHVFGLNKPRTAKQF